ncbi:unnamed protein product, partial [Symbiodinium sp. CCMP2592]
PKAIGKIKQERLSSREQLQAVMHVMNLLDLDYEKAEVLLRGADPARSIWRQSYGTRSFLCKMDTGEASWQQASREVIRLVLQADQGGPLYATFQFLAGLGYPVSFVRDELCSGCIQFSCPCCHQNANASKSDMHGVRVRHKVQNRYLKVLNATPGCRRTWGLKMLEHQIHVCCKLMSLQIRKTGEAWAYAGKRYMEVALGLALAQPDDVLQQLFAEVGKNPFAISSIGPVNAGDFDKVVDLCMKAGRCLGGVL